jgi:hypothetical protein
MGAVLAAGRPAVLSHRDGAALWELPDFTSPHVEVTLPELGGRAQPGIRVHRTRRLPPEERTILRGVPVTTVERLMVDLAAVISPRHLRDVLVEAERKRLVDHRMMRRTLEGSAGRRGIRVLRRMVDQLTPAFAETRSPFEVDFLEFCRKQTLPEPQVNVWVSGYLVDAYWPDANLVVELDSYEFHRDRRAFERDRAEIADLKLAGIDAIPITYRRLSTEPTKVASVIRHELAKPHTPTP